MATKRGQAAGAAVLLAIIVGLIIFFILVLPPEEREKLLAEEAAEEEIPAGAEEVLLRESPGRISYIKEKEIEKVMPATHIFTKAEPVFLVERGYLAIKKALFSSQIEEIYFKIDDLAHTENILLDFAVETHQGKLIILLNKKEIFNREVSAINPLKLPKSLLAPENTLTFKVSSPGIAFWRTNHYDLKNVRVVADVTDISTQESKQSFYISSDEAQNIEEAGLRFVLSCLPEKLSVLEVKVNDQSIFSGTPESCGDIFSFELSPEIIKTGSNQLSFKTEEGDYEIYQTAVKIRLKRIPHPLYTFELDEKYFTAEEGETKLKEDYDVVFTFDFAGEERKEAEIYINGHKLSFDTYKMEFSYAIDDYVEPWANSIKIVPKTSFDVRELKVELKSD